MITVADVDLFFAEKQGWIQRSLRYCFRHNDQDECVQNAMTLAYKNVATCARHGKIANHYDLWTFVKTSMSFAVRMTRRGQSIQDMGYTRRDVTEVAPRDHGYRIEDLAGHTDDPADAATLRADFADFLHGLSDRHRSMFLDMLAGYTTSELAERYEVSAGAISQWRRRLVDMWHEFTDL